MARSAKAEEEKSKGESMQTIVTFANLPLEVSGDYVPKNRGGAYEPAEDAYIDDMTIKLGEHDITDILSEKDIEEIQTLALKVASL